MADIDVRLRATMDIGDVVSNVSAIQKSFSRLKLPDNISGNLSKKFAELANEYDRYQKKIAGGIKTQGDYNQVENSLNRMRTLYQEIGIEAKKVGNLDLSKMLNLSSGDFGKLTQEIEKFKELSKVKIDFSSVKDQINALRGALKNEKFSGKGGLIDQLVGNIDAGKITEIKATFQSIQEEVAKITPKTDASGNFIAGLVGKLNPANAEAVRRAFQDLGTEFASAEQKANPFIQKLEVLQKELTELKIKTSNNILKDINKFGAEAKNVDRVTNSLKRMHAEEFGFNRQVQMIDRQIQSYFGLSQMIRKVGNIAKSAFNTVKELDKAMTATAVVTNFSVGDMWDMLPTYTEQANQLGATIKDVYEAATLYYQQGLNTNQAMGLANETLKMARIAGMDAAEATDMMTAALRGFNMEINQVSAQRINDVYSQLAAITASNTQEIGTAMEKTASLANSANMDFETTSAFLAQMIETTREAPENLGTAMKTIVARFQEMKKDPTKLVDSEGVAMDVNKVDAALKSIGVALTNTKGEFRDLDDVFLDIASRWDTLSQGQQRYIATTAAGSRQQSRFIAMMSNYDRTMELVEAANNSAGASQKQFEKTMDSMSSKLNQLKNAWNQFTMGLMNNQILKTGVTALTGFLTVVNKIINALSKPFPDPFGGMVKSILTLGATLTGLNFAKNLASGAVMAGAGWWRGEGSIRQNFMNGYNTSYNNRPQYTREELVGRTMLPKFSNEALKNMGVTVTEAPVQVSTYLEEIKNAEDLPAQVKEKIHAIFAGSNNSEITEEQRVKINAVLTDADKQATSDATRDAILNGKDPSNIKDPNYTGRYGVSEERTTNGLNNLTKRIGSFNSGLITMGMTLQRVGSQLGPFGAILSVIGTVMMTLGSTLGMLTVKIADNIALAIADTDATLAETISKQGLTVATLSAAKANGVLASSIARVILPYLALAAAIAAVYIVFKEIDKASVTNKEKLEQASEAAARASEEYNTAKQELSELNNSIEQVQSNEEVFKGLIAGTADFNEKLVEANQTITELINKYPELNDPKYLSTDKNGLMHINQSGIDFIKEQQNQIVGNAAAISGLQSAQLKAEEDRQEADRLLKESRGEVAREKGKKVINQSGVGVDLSVANSIEAKEEDQRTADMLNQRADAVERMSKQQAIYNSLTGAELTNREKIAAIYEGTYDTVLKETEKSKASIEEMRKAYADFYGYTYNESRKKITDDEGKEIKEITDEVVKDAFPEITVLANIEANGESLDRMVSTIDSTFSKEMGVNLTDILSSNIETDENALQRLIQDPNGLREAIGELEDKEIAALLNVNEEDVSKHFDKYADQLAENTEERAKAIFEAQTQVNSELGAMMAQAQYADTNFHQQGWQQIVASSISKQILKLTVEQRNMLNTVGKALQENVGADAMSTFLNEASSIYLTKDKSLINEFDNALDGINWDSATSRLEGYNKMMRSTQSEIRQMGEDMRTSSNEASLLGDSFEEFLGGDWLDLSEKADEFKNAVGEIDGAGILKAAESSGQLKAILDSGEVSASGLAMTLQGVEDGSILQVNDAVLQLVSSLNKVADVALEAHNIVENFDPGIDYGEGEDFMIENAKKVKEYMDNGEWGNQQLQNYIKMAAGQERWDKALARHKGNLAETARDLQHYATDFSEGTADVWDKLVNEKGADGDTFEHNLNTMEDKALKKRFEKAGVNFDWSGEDGTLQVEIGDLTTEEFEQYLQEVGGMSEDYAKLMIQDLANYDATVSSTLRANDIQAMGQNPELQENRISEETGKIVFTSEELDAIKALSGEDGLKSLAKGLKIPLEELKENSLRTTEKDGTERTDYKRLMGDYYRAYYDSESKGLQNIINKFSENGQFDIGKLIEDATSKGLTDEQALQGAYKAYEESGGSVLYEGMEIEAGLNIDEFAQKMEEITESSQWVTVGETIGQQIVSALDNSSMLDEIRSGEKDGAFSEEGGTTESFKEGIDAIKNSGESREKQQSDVEALLQNSKEQFDKLNPEQQALALKDVVTKLDELGLKPDEIASAIKNGLGFDPTKSDSSGTGALSTDQNGKVTLDLIKAKESLEEQLKDPVEAAVEIGSDGVDKFVEDLNKKLQNLDASIEGSFKGFVSGTSPGLATGQNNPNSVFHRTGTMARGSRGGYTISGRPTLTGEEGEELVWEPKQNRAYMVGSNGPQFANISKSAVVWNADQTKRIKKNSGSVGHFGTGARGINNFGTMARGTTVPGVYSANVIGLLKELLVSKEAEEVSLKGKVTEIVNATGSGLTNKINKLFGKKDEGLKLKVPAEVTSIKPKEGTDQFIDVIAIIKDLRNQAGELKEKITGTAIVKKVIKSGKVSGEPVNVKATATVNADANTDKAAGKITQMAADASSTQTMTLTADSGPAKKKVDTLVNYIKHKKPEMSYTVSGPSKVEVPVKLIYDGSWSRTITFKKAAKGMNNYIPYQTLPSIASAASGRYGRLGPNGKGGPTLTGEKGYEIAWIPSESRSMILGANGPQMIDLPSDTVVWTHEQSKKIMNQKAIPAGSHAIETGKKKSSSSTDKSSSKSTNKSSSNKGGGGDKKTSKKHKTNADNTEKLIKKAGRVLVWWENQERRVDAIQRKIDKNQTAFEKALSKVGATFESVKKDVGAYLASLKKSISINEESKTKAGNTLKNISTKSKKEKTNDAAAKKAQKKVDKAKKTKDKKDDVKAKKALEKAQKKQKGISYKTVSWEETKKKGKKTEKVKQKQKINLSDYIKKDTSTGAYIIDQAALDREGKKSKAKAKAIKEAATKAIETPQGRYNTAEDNINKAQQDLDSLGQKLYETFHGWEIELTKIWNLTQKISNVEAKTNRLKEALSLQEAQLSSGLYQATSSFNKNTLTIFTAQLKTLNESITNRSKLIGEQQDSLKKLFTGESTKKTLSNVNSKLNKDKTAAEKQEKYNAQKAKAEKQNKKISDYTKKIEEQKKKRDAAKDKIKKIKENKKLSSSEKKKKIEEQNKIIEDANTKIKKYKSKRDATQENLKATKKKRDTAKANYKKVSGNLLADADRVRLEEEQKRLKDEEKIRKTALKYVTYSANGDGTYNISFNTEAFEKDKEELGITSDDASKIQEYVKEIQSQNEELNNSYTEQTQELSELYTTLSDLQQKQADNANELLDIVEGEQQKELEKIRGLSESLNEAMRDLLDEVKESLTQRRNREDNLKTEQDISKKQQRLAALRADTSGGHAVEIAQLEKEIADAQQSYGRTLEDQLLDKLQKQADEAAKQRERMIELQEALLEGSGEQSNLDQVNKWMALIKQNSKGDLSDEKMEPIWEEIKAQFMSNRGYDKLPDEAKPVVEAEWERFKNELATNYEEREAVKSSINTASKNLEELNTSITTLIGAINNPPKEQTGALDKDEDKKPTKTSAKTPSAKDKLIERAKSAAKNNKISAKELINVKNYANKLGLGAKDYLQELANTSLTWEQILTAAKDSKQFSPYSLAKSFSSDAFQKAFNKVYGNGQKVWKLYKDNPLGKAYATGGLNTQTGPAWLDGTPTKPELVLNAADTKNFLALRDVLGDVMGAINSTDNSYRSNDVYNINVNVDKIASDYDVNKMVEKVKKEITKSAGYRNVTQARTFR